MALDPGFADAKIAAVSCLQNLAFLRRHEPAAGGLVNRFVPLLKELSASAIENPRFLWVQGASLWYALPGLSDTQIAERRARALATYQRGLQLARTATLPSTPLEPSWGEPELLMNLGWSYLNGSTPDLKAADTHTRQALALVPHWHYVRDILLPQIEQTKAQRRLDVFVGRWKARGETYPEAYGAAAGETTGVVINRRTARDNWLLSEVTLDAVPPYGVTVVLAPKPDGSYVALAVNNMVPAALQYSGRWVDERVLELEMPAPVSGRRQRVRYTLISDDRMEFLVTESRDDGQSYPRHSSLTLSREP